MNKQNESEYAFQAMYGLSLERGRVRASSKTEAKELIKSYGYRWSWLWPQGHHPWWSWEPFHGLGDSGLNWFPFQFKEKRIGDQIVYRYPKIYSILASGVITSLSLVFMWFCLFHSVNIAVNIPWLILACLMLFLGFLIAGMSSEKIVDTGKKRLTLLTSFFGFIRFARSFHASQIKSITISREKYYDADTTYTLCLTRICLDKIDIQADASTSQKKAIQRAQSIAEHLNIPFINEIN